MIRFVIALTVSLLVASAGSALASGPTAKVMPNKHLTNGESVKAKGRGYVPNEAVVIVECNATVTSNGAAACDLNNIVFVTSTAHGVVPATNFTVKTGPIGNGSCGTSKADAACYIAVSAQDQSEFALVPILFKVK